MCHNHSGDFITDLCLFCFKFDFKVNLKMHFGNVEPEFLNVLYLGRSSLYLICTFEKQPFMAVFDGVSQF